MTNLERLKYMLEVPEDYDSCDIAIFLDDLILKAKCESFNDIRQELLDNYNPKKDDENLLSRIEVNIKKLIALREKTLDKMKQE